MTALLIDVWNVEHGSAIYAKTPNGRHILMDAGKSTEFSPAEHLSKIGYSDVLYISHTDEDHIRDIENVEEFIPPKVLVRNKTVDPETAYATYPPEEGAAKAYYDFDKRYNTPVESGSENDVKYAEHWGGVEQRFYYNSGADYDLSNNDHSLLVTLEYTAGEETMLFIFPGDLEEPGWQAMLDREDFQEELTNAQGKDKIRFLVASHHGRESGVCTDFLARFRPHLTIMQCKADDEYSAEDVYEEFSLGYNVKRGDTRESLRCVGSDVNTCVIITAAEGVGIRVKIPS